MHRTRRITGLFALTLLTVASPRPLHAQFLKKIKDKVAQRVDKAEDKGIDHALDKVESCVSTNKECIARAKRDGKPVVITDAKGNRVSSADSARAVAAADTHAPAAQSDAAASADDTPAAAFINYDFVPGDRVLFAEDFANDQVGDIPSRVTVKSGNWEVADFMGQRFLRTTTRGWFVIPLPSVLPDRFTFEADIIQGTGHNTELYFLPDNQQDGHDYIFSGNSGGIGEYSAEAEEDVSSKLYHLRVMADGGHVKVYEDGKRVANVPQANLGRSKQIWVSAPGTDAEPFYITNIRVAESQKSLFDVLNAKGRVSTHGILFSVNSDHIRPESAPTLKLIADMLQSHPTLKLTIEGHTDATGDAKANQVLSEKRAASVKAYLVDHFHVSDDRLYTTGYGASKPVAPNTTPEGRQQNRRVELVKVS